LLSGLLTTAQAKCRALSDASLKNEGAEVPYTPHIAIDQNPQFDEGDRVGCFDGYFDFEKGAVLYFHPTSRDPAYQPPTKNYLKNMADTSPYPLVVKHTDISYTNFQTATDCTVHTTELMRLGESAIARGGAQTTLDMKIELAPGIRIVALRDYIADDLDQFDETLPASRRQNDKIMET
jgi:hypothetical protein